MRLIVSGTHDPFLNLASESLAMSGELFEGQDCFFLYADSPCVVIGRHQNAYAEADVPFLEKTGIPLLRRVSGGGAVYHDPGNLNCCLWLCAGSARDAAGMLSAVMADALCAMGVEFTLTERRDILADGFKISGCAQAKNRTKTLAHATLLVSADLGMLSRTLNSGMAHAKSKAVASVRSRVANLAGLADSGTDIAAVARALAESASRLAGAVLEPFSAVEAEALCLARPRLASWEHNFASSPPFSFASGGCLVLADAGRIIRIEAQEQGNSKTSSLLSARLGGCRLNTGDLEGRMDGAGSDELALAARILPGFLRP